MSRFASIRWIALAALSIATAAFVAVGPALAADDSATATRTKAKDVSTGNGVSLTEVDASGFPVVRVAFGADEVDGDTPPLTYFENGEPLGAGVSLYRGEIGEYEDPRPTHVMLVLDTSLSMGFGTRFEDAVAAANKLIDRARPGDKIGLATFGGDAKVVVKPTTKLEKVRAAMADLQLADRTTMFDAVSASAGAFDRSAKANRAMVLLSDGKDVGSVETLDEAAGEAIKAQAPIFTVAIRENADDQPRDLAELGNGTGGELRTVVGSDGLDELFAELGRRILQPYWIEYRSSAPQGRELTFGIGVGRKASTPDATRTFRAVPTAAALSAADLPEAHPKDPIIPIPGGMQGVLIASIPFAILIFSFVWMMLDRRTTPNVLARIERYTALASETSVRREEPDGSMFRTLAAPFMKMSDAFLGRSAFFDRISFRAEQAAIAIKPSELFTAMLAFGALGLLIGLAVGKLFLVPILGVVMFYAPNFWLRMKARKRRNSFDDQLPDVLQGISSSLKAGHSFNQAINAMIKDAPNPTSEEFSRVMTEARLGMPIEQALQHMADRMGSEDFDFAVTTVNIQRTVGGSLADILQMVGDTVRNRQQFRKKVKALTSMGQMSAYVLLGMPVFIALALTVMSPDYMAPLYGTTTGHLMIAAACFSMALGYFACMKVVSVKV
ncbi:MAG: type II secretion system F family protein [Thermoleophilia bacterium]|nr:type II secretion system F family protein [Thermoleophilia bacterium]